MPIYIDNKEITEIWLPGADGTDKEIIKVIYTLDTDTDKVVFEKKSSEITDLDPVYEFVLTMKDDWSYNPQAVPKISIGNNNVNIDLKNEDTNRHTKWNNKSCTIKYTLGEVKSNAYIHINGDNQHNLEKLESIQFRTLYTDDKYTIYFGVHNCTYLKQVSFDSYIEGWQFENGENFDSCPEFEEAGTGEMLVFNDALYNSLINHYDHANLFSNFDRTKIVLGNHL